MKIGGVALNRNHFELEQQMKQRQREIEQAGREAWKFLERDSQDAETKRGPRINIILIFRLVIQFIKK
jgi:hypothetical protein